MEIVAWHVETMSANLRSSIMQKNKRQVIDITTKKTVAKCIGDVIQCLMMVDE